VRELPKTLAAGNGGLARQELKGLLGTIRVVAKPIEMLLFAETGFVEALEGFVNRPSPWKFHDVEGREYPIETCYATGKLRRVRGIATGEFEFVRAHTRRTPKVTIPSPSFMHFFQGATAPINRSILIQKASGKICYEFMKTKLPLSEALA